MVRKQEQSIIMCINTYTCNKIQDQQKKMRKDDQINQDEDQIITIIKSIASEILTDDDFPFGQNYQDKCNILKFSSVKSQKENNFFIPRKYTLYTERGQVEREDCQSQWIDYHDMRDVQVQQNNIIKNPQQKTPKKQPQASTNPQKPHSQARPQAHPTKNPQKNPSQSVSLQSSQNAQKHSLPPPKLKLQQLDQYGFMKPKNPIIKQMIITDMYRKQENQELQISQVKKSYKTLEQLYQEKQPLYIKYLKQKERRNQAVYQSRVQEEKKIEQLNPKPQINTNIPVQGTFIQRQKTNIKKSQQQKSKIISQILQQIPFKPQTNTSQKYKKIESKVKQNWKQKKQSPQKQETLAQTQKQALTSASASTKTLSKISVSESRKDLKRGVPKLVTRYNTEASSLKLNGTSELSHILEIQDCFFD